MKLIALIASLLPITASATDIVIFAATLKDDASTYRLVASPPEVRLLEIQLPDPPTLDIGNGPEELWPVMRMRITDDVGARVYKFATDHRLELVHLRVFVDGTSYGAISMPRSGFGSLHGNLLWVGILPDKRKKKEPNKAMQPTPVAVTPRANARVAPSTSVADL